MNFRIALLVFLAAVLLLTPAVSASDVTLFGPSSVIAGNDFVLTISGGEPKGYVTLSMVSGNRPDLVLIPGQIDISGSATSASVQLDAGGRARVEYSTTSGGDESNCKFQVTDGSSLDTITVKITRGTMSATISPTQRPSQNTYTIGSEVPLSGVATGSNNVYLFVIGPNLPSGGAKLDNPSVSSVTNNKDTFVVRSVNNGRWSYNWKTSGQLDAGTYTIYAVDRPSNRNDLSGASYSTYSVHLGRPGLSAGGSTDPKPTVTSVPVVTVTETPKVIETTPAPTPTEVATPSLWDVIVSWFESLFGK